MNDESHFIYRLVNGLERTELPNGCAIAHRARNEIHYLNQPAADILGICDGCMDVEGIAAAMQSLYALPTAPLDDVRTCLADLAAKGLIIGNLH